jgi:hypothetical protein
MAHSFDYSRLFGYALWHGTDKVGPKIPFASGVSCQKCASGCTMLPLCAGGKRVRSAIVSVAATGESSAKTSRQGAAPGPDAPVLQGAWPGIHHSRAVVLDAVIGHPRTLCCESLRSGAGAGLDVFLYIEKQ